jgi:hypothetical protein
LLLDVEYGEQMFSFIPVTLLGRGYIVPRRASLATVGRLIAKGGGVLFPVALLNKKQLTLWTALVVPLTLAADFGVDIPIPYSILALPFIPSGITNCTKWAAEAALAAIVAQVVPF